ncbi:ribonuclease III domain-containing protein [Aphanothece sacrum]|uniref:Ribonuclease 3 n=1 Tax=Aphanothece sacrum FPU1 TaxID=1920663 RepID=A0A401ILV7_APHSA|nr:ribonuclease III domain-containing protein [Aphanothece sacrum]GBF82216.1 ribonuclease III [Aphanothece sacrum FPU1]GBF87246.1 ribonuclease III [Aphanothece sacrum FPU3]
MEWNSEIVENKISIQFKNSELLFLALTHSSYAQQINTPEKDNERLEFLGDKILNLVIVDYLYHHFPYLPMTKFTALRDKLMEGERLTQVWFKLGLGEGYPFIALTEERHRLKVKRNNPFEKALKAIIGAIHLDRGFSQSYNWVNKQLMASLLGRHQQDAKERFSPDKQLQLLGDTLLKAIMIDYLYRLLPYVNPTRLTKLSKEFISKEKQTKYLSGIEIDPKVITPENEKVIKKSFPALLGAMYLSFETQNSKTRFAKSSDWLIKKVIDEDDVLREAIALLLKEEVPQKWIIKEVLGYDSKDYDAGRERFHKLMEKL